ncbi:hypothetical protein AB0M43_37925 [Longispora sp. NPDC051575]|uniref:hypothetical protein n=1 Tax=Longispora sp. NPDC051575 TaxID=3154943 RepID=UPI003425CC32
MRVSGALGLTGAGMLMCTLLTGCGTGGEAQFADVAAARAAGGGPASWVPDWVPDGAADIRVRWDLDSNDSILRFRHTGAWQPPTACTATTAPGGAALTASWWPAQLPDGTDYTCAQQPMALRIAGDAVYAWSTR